MLIISFFRLAVGRSPHRERGLKPGQAVAGLPGHWSLPSPGAWIETVSRGAARARLRSLPSPGAWIETLGRIGIGSAPASLPSPGAWIETRWRASASALAMVAPLTGSVD